MIGGSRPAAIRHPPRPHGDAARAAMVFAGDLAVYRRVPALRPLLALARTRLEAAFGGLDPERAHRSLDAGEYGRRMAALRKAWRHDDAVRAAWIDVFRDIGLDLDEACYDWFYIRALPPGDSHLGAHTPRLPPHRDTWGSNLYQQINWWAPIYPITARRTFAVYPDRWRRPVKNASAAWDLQALRRLPPAERRHFPKLPEVMETPARAVPVVLEPGEVMAFSAQHLHRSCRNTTTLARFNLECRTVSAADVAAGRAAPNIDGAAPHVAWDWFKRLTDAVPLGEVLGARGTPAAPISERRGASAT